MEIKVGPYMVVKGKIKSDLTNEVKTCSNQKCKVHKERESFDEEEHKFCSLCGSKLEMQSLKFSEVIDASDLFYEDDLVKDIKYNSEKIANRLWLVDQYEEQKGVVTFTTEKRMPFESKERKNCEDYEVVDLTKVNIEEEMKWFRETFKPEIQLFEKIFGEGSVTIHWGVVQY